MSSDLIIIAIPSQKGWSAWREFFDIHDDCGGLWPITTTQRPFEDLPLLHPSAPSPDSILTREIQLYCDDSGVHHTKDRTITQLDAEGCPEQLVWFPDADTPITGTCLLVLDGGRRYHLEHCSWQRQIGYGAFLDRAFRPVPHGSSASANGLGSQDRVWLNPVVLQLSLFREYSKRSLDLVRLVLRKDLFDRQILHCWPESEAWRYYGRRFLLADSCSSDSLLRLLFCGNEDSVDSFECLDRLGGCFVVSDFGTGAPKVEIRCGKLTALAASLAHHLAEGSLIAASEKVFAGDRTVLPPPKPVHHQLTSIRSAEGWPAVEELLAGVTDATHRNVANRMAGVFGVMPSHLRHELAERVLRVHAHEPAHSALDSLCRVCMAPRSPVLVEFPTGDILEGRIRRSTLYREFQRTWAFDAVRSPRFGAIGFVRRMLDCEPCHSSSGVTTVRADGVVILMYKFGWWYEWQEALWTTNYRVQMVMWSDDDLRRLGTMPLGLCKLGACPRSPYAQPKHIYFCGD